MMSADMPNTTSAPPVGRILVHTAPPAPLEAAILLRLLEAEERFIRAQRQALDARAREIGQLLAQLRAG